MGDYNKDSEQDKGKAFESLLRGICDFPREKLLAEFEAASNLDSSLPIPKPDPDEFKKIWARVQADRAKLSDTTELPESEEPGDNKVIKVRFGWKRLAAIGLIACLIAGSGCMVSMGTKSYFFQERKDENASDGKILNNDMNKVALNGEEEAYLFIEEELNIKPLKLGYIPDSMEFSSIEKGSGYVNIEFAYEDGLIYFIQSKFEKKVSYNYKSDTVSVEESNVYNKWLQKEIKIKKETLTNGNVAFESTIIVDGSYYSLLGIIEESVFKKMIEQISF